MEQPTEAQIKEFWEWCGIDIAKFTDGIPLERIGEGRYMAHPIDLNNLFKYAVPKAREIGATICLDMLLTCTLATIVYRAKMYEASEKDSTLALFWALWEVKEVA